MVRRKRQCMKRESHGGIKRRQNQVDLGTLADTPPWDWPRDAGKIFHALLTDNKANQSDRLIAAELAGDFTVINNELSDALLGIVSGADQPEQLRAAAAISLGPVLEQADLELEDTGEFEDPDDVPIGASTFHRIRRELHKLYSDDRVPREVRRRILEASVRSPQNWHRDAISRAYSSGDKDWVLTAVFSMRQVRGFDEQIMEALKSGDPAIEYEAVQAAGNWELNSAWSHIARLVQDPATPKHILLAAIDAIAGIRPGEAGAILADLLDSDDEEIVEAADEALTIAEGSAGRIDDDLDTDDLDTDDWIN
jgi:uncharacterized protein (UPF0147 family)